MSATRRGFIQCLTAAFVATAVVSCSMEQSETPHPFPEILEAWKGLDDEAFKQQFKALDLEEQIKVLEAHSHQAHRTGLIASVIAEEHTQVIQNFVGRAYIFADKHFSDMVKAETATMSRPEFSPDENKKKIRVRQLVDFTAGLLQMAIQREAEGLPFGKDELIAHHQLKALNEKGLTIIAGPMRSLGFENYQAAIFGPDLSFGLDHITHTMQINPEAKIRSVQRIIGQAYRDIDEIQSDEIAAIYIDLLLKPNSISGIRRYNGGPQTTPEEQATLRLIGLEKPCAICEP